MTSAPSLQWWLVGSAWPSPSEEHLDPSFLILCFEGDPTVSFYRARWRAESSMEAEDIEEWTVYDVEGYRRGLSPKAGGAIAIGERFGGPEMDQLLSRLRGHLASTRPDQRWESAPLAALLEAVEEDCRLAEARDLRRAKKSILVVLLALAGFVFWFLGRRSIGHGQ